MSRQLAGLAWGLAIESALIPGASGAEPARLTLERIITEDEFRTEGFGPARRLDDGSGYTTLEPASDGRGRAIVRQDPATGRREVLVPTFRLVPEGRSGPLAIDDHAWSDVGASLLIFTDTRRVWRQNTRGDCWTLRLAGGPPRKLGGDGPGASTMFARFGPGGRRFAYVREGNLFVQSLADGRITPLTTDGSPTRINGTFDRVYEEEFSLRDGYRWSPDGRSIAYWQVDTEGMKEYVLVNTTADLYPRLTAIR